MPAGVIAAPHRAVHGTGPGLRRRNGRATPVTCTSLANREHTSHHGPVIDAERRAPSIAYVVAVPDGPLPQVVLAAAPQALLLADAVGEQSAWLREQGFDPESALAVTASCRDELVEELRAVVRRHWHKSFDFSSLAGLPLAGVTGMQAALGHAPQAGERTQMVVFAMPHVGILADGTSGLAVRRGRPEPSSACGSLAAARAWARDVMRNPVSLAEPIDELDAEQSMVRIRLLRRIPELADIPMLPLVERTCTIMRDDLWTLTETVTNPAVVDVALLTGLLIHGPDGNDYLQWAERRLRTGGRTTVAPRITAEAHVASAREG